MLPEIVKSFLIFFVFATTALQAGAQSDTSFERAIGESLTNVNPFPFGDDVADCIGKNAIDNIGSWRLRSLGITAKNAKSVFGSPPFSNIDFTDSEIEILLDSVDRCISFVEIWDYAVQHTKNAAELLDTDDIKEALTHCVHTVFEDSELPRELWHTLFTKSNDGFQAKYQELVNVTNGCFEAIFCGKSTILGSMGMPTTVLPGGNSISFDYGGGSGGITFHYSLPILSMNVCPFSNNSTDSKSKDNK